MSKGSTAQVQRVQIFGQTLTIRGSAEDAYVRALANYVNSHMERLSKEAPLMPATQVAMLAALNITHELFELRRQTESREATLDAKTRRLLDDIDTQFHPKAAEGG